MPTITVNGSPLEVRRDGFSLSYERSVDLARTPANALRVAVLGDPKRIAEVRSVPMSWTDAQSWLTYDQSQVSVAGDYITMTAWCHVEVHPLPLGRGEVRLRLEEV
jgi:hypothetical protein